MWPALIAALGGIMGSGGAAAGGAGAAGAGAGAAGVGAGAAGAGAGGANLGMQTLMGAEVGGGPGQGLWTDLISPDPPAQAQQDPWYSGLFGNEYDASGTATQKLMGVYFTNYPSTVINNRSICY